MRKFTKYLQYVLRHKWFVFLECCKLGIPFRGIIHDLSKFLPSEFFPYMNHFYGDKNKESDLQFDKQWLKHIHRNKHHWQYWILTSNYNDNEYTEMEMPIKYAKEMIADWVGASRQQGYGSNIVQWYEKNKDKIKLHPYTRVVIEDYVDKYKEFIK